MIFDMLQFTRQLMAGKAHACMRLFLSEVTSEL